MKTRFAPLALVVAAACGYAQEPHLADWQTLLVEKKDAEAARALCTSFTGSKVLAEQVEAEKCLANVALSGNGGVMLEGDDAGGGNLRGGYKPEAVDEALKHLNRGLQLAPNDLSIHQGRLHVLEASGRYREMIEALDESASIYKGKDALDAWMAYAAELGDLRQYQAGLDFMKVIEKHFPDSPDVIGNIGAFLSIQGKTKEAIPYLEKAAQSAPQDPINAWDLGRAYDRDEQIALAETWYNKGISLMTDPAQIKQSRCIYAEFVEKKLKDAPRACKLQIESCEPDRRTACAGGPEGAKKPQ